ERTEVVEAEPRLLAEVHLGDEEMHVLADVAAEDRRGSFRQRVAILGEPCLQSVALLRGEDEDVVLADGVLRLDRDAETLRAVARFGGAGDSNRFRNRVRG